MYQIETYVIYVKGDWVVMATIAHNRTNKEIGEICQDILDDAKIDEESCFITEKFWNYS